MNVNLRDISIKLLLLLLLEIKMNGVDVTETTFYEYLGVTMDKSLTLAGHLNKVIKKASSRTNLLNRIRHNVNPYTRQKPFTKL